MKGILFRRFLRLWAVAFMALHAKTLLNFQIQNTGMRKSYTCLLVLFLFSYQFLSAGCITGQKQVIVTIVPDLYPQETSWSLHDAITGALIDTGLVNSDTICIGTSQCMNFTIFDAYGDGICCNYGIGSYTVTLNGTVVASGGQFGHSETTYFNCPPGHDCTVPLVAVKDTMTAPGPETWYIFTPDSTGLYDISTCDLGNTCDTKIYIYDHCHNLLVAEDNTGTTFYNDDGCPNFQSFISAAMPAGATYYIRIGDYLNSCAGDTINWQIQFVGPIAGCTDSTSCNYNPLATVPDGSCIYPPSPLCPAPDLAVDQDMLRSSMYSDNLVVANGDCYVNEGCLAGYGNRRLIRFTTHIRNIGDLDYYIGTPDSSNSQFVWDPCHQHWHYVGYAEYLLFDQFDQQVQVGFKNGFCVLDLECSGGGTGKYNCGDMGITAGCGDIYDAGLNCQWIDVTDVDTGNYTLVVRVNWDRSPDKLGHYERSYANNWAQVCIRLYYDTAGNKIFDTLAFCPVYVDCAGDTFGSAQQDCMGTCNGSVVRGDLNVDSHRDTTDMLLYLTGVTAETLLPTTCNDLNNDGRVTVADASRINGCLRHLAGTLTNYTNAQSAQHLCEFPYSVTDVLDTVTFSIANVDWQHHFFDIGVLNPLTQLMGYELKLQGATVDSVKNLALGNYIPGIYYSHTGHITELSNEDGSLFKQLAPLNFLRVYYSGLHDSTLCIASVIDVVDENYEQVTGIALNACVTNTDTTASVAEVLNESDLQTIPNPSNGVFDCYISGKSLFGASIKIFDAMGRMIYENPANEGLSNKIRFDLSNQQSGLYLLQINVKGAVVVKRLVLTK